MAVKEFIAKRVANLTADIEKITAIIAAAAALADSPEAVKMLMAEAQTILELGIANEVDHIEERCTAV